MASYICLWFDVVLARQFWCNIRLLPFWLTAVVLCVSESPVSCVQHLVRSVGQSRGCRCVFVDKACVTASLHLTKQQWLRTSCGIPCSTAGDKKLFTSSDRRHTCSRTYPPFAEPIRSPSSFCAEEGWPLAHVCRLPLL